MTRFLTVIAILFATPAWAQTQKNLSYEEKVKLGKVINLAANYEAFAEHCDGKTSFDQRGKDKNKIAETMTILHKHLSQDDYREVYDAVNSGKLDRAKGQFYGSLAVMGSTPDACGYLLGLNIGITVAGGGLDFYEQLTGQKF